MATRKVIVKDISPRCLTEDSGRKLLDVVSPILESGDEIEVDFQGITMFATLFFNNSLARLFDAFDPVFVKTHLHVVNINETGRKTFSRSMENAAEFFRLDPDARAQIASIVAAVGGR